MRLLWRVDKFECLSIIQMSSAKRVGVPNTALGKSLTLSRKSKGLSNDP